MLVLRIELDVGYVDDRALEDRPARLQGPGWARREYAVQLLEAFGGEVVLGDEMDQLAVELKSAPKSPSHNLTALLTIVSKTGCTSVGELLITRRISLVAVRSRFTSLQLVEQPHVLDRDHRLVGEGLEQRDLVVGEPAGLAAGHRDRPDRLVVTEQRHRHPASVATDTSGGVRGFGQSGIGVGVGDIERRSIANGLGVRPLGVERPWEERPQRQASPASSVLVSAASSI